MKRTSFVLFLVLLLCSLVGTCAAASAATGAVPLRPTPDKEIPREAETVLHRLKQACSSNCIEDNFQISDKQDLNERLCKDFCRFIFYAFKKNSKEFYGLVKSNSLSAIVKAHTKTPYTALIYTDFT